MPEVEERYRTLLGSMADGFALVEMIFDETGQRAVNHRFVEMNRAFVELTGVPDPIGKTARELYPDLGEEWFQIYGRVALTGEEAHFERTNPYLGRTFEVHAMRVGPPEKRRLALLFRDVTARRQAEDARKEAEEALRESEQRAREAAARAETERGILDAILEAAPAGIIVADAGGRLVRMNAANERLWGIAPYSKSVDEYREWKGYWADKSERHGQRLEPEEWAMSRALRGETVHDDIVEIEPFGEPGKRRTMVNSGAPVRDAQGRITGAIVAQMDISALVQSEAALRALNEKLREADRRKDEFIGILAHELRNPLAPVRNAVEILRRAGVAEPRVERARSVIERQVAHMARLIDDLLDVSRIARGKLALQREACDLSAIARQTAEDYRASIEESGLRLVIAGAKEPAWVEGDPVRLAQMIANLLHNAARFTDRGGQVEVRAEVSLDARQALVSVTDTGVGIPPDLLSRLFDPFSQADQDLARSKGGLGLGLSLTRGLAELHGGAVEVRSEGLGRGATFTLRIPLLASRYASLDAGSGPAMDGGALRVLIVEDNRDAAETLAELLSLEGHEVRLAFDGATAVQAAKELPPDAVISDIGLPGELDGYSVARALRADPATAGVYLIALSGYANEDARRRSREAGFDVHLAKPADITMIERALTVVTRRS